MAKVVKFIDNIEVSSGAGNGYLLQDIFGGIKYLLTGQLDQVTVRKTSGDVTKTVNIQLRYITDNDTPEKLAYLYLDADFDAATSTFVDSDVKAPFSLRSRGIDGYLSFYIESPDEDCELNVRLDFDINNISGT